jgi:enamine deaminase RidA (YjgF/YER057c/UK114 family)
MRSLVAAILLAASAAGASAADPAPTREHFAPPGMEAAYHDWHYTPALKVGDTVYVSGIPAVGPGSYEDKVRRMFGALKQQLELAGATLADVVELTTYHVQSTDAASFQQEFERFAPIHHAFFANHYPAWNAVGTTALLSPGAVVEMRAVAVIGSGRAPKADIPPPKTGPKTGPVTPPKKPASAGLAPTAAMSVARS